MNNKITEKVLNARKPASEYPVMKEIVQRFSPRNFTGEDIPEKDIKTILEAARMAPSARNIQPWYFYWMRRDSDTFNRIYEVLNENNKWANTASVLIVCTYIPKTEKGENEYASHDLGAAVFSMIIQATNMGYHARQMGLFDKVEAKKIVRAREEEFPFVIVAMGKIGDYANAPEEIIQRDMTPAPRKEDFEKELK